ncbi:hemolysin family protein [Faecalimonas sp.]
MDTDPDGTQIFTQLIILVILTLVNAFFAGAELAVVSVNKNKIHRLAEEGNKKALLIQSLFTDSTKFLSTIQVAITCAGFFSSASAATGISKVLGERLQQIQVPYADTISFFGVTIILMYFNLVFGELVPKRIALQKAEAFCFLTVKPIYYISNILSPFISLLSVSTNGFMRLIGMKTEEEEENISEDEIKSLIEKGRMTGVIEEHESEMLKSVFSFDDKCARDIMTPRREVYAIDLKESIEEQVVEILESRHSRIPIYEGNIDNIIGILHINDYMIAKETGNSEKDICALLQKPYFVPDSKAADELFIEMQKNQKRMALLLDEYGGLSGIITIEDLVEEIVGDINEENDCVQPEVIEVEKNHYLVDGKMLVEDLNNKMNLNLQTENYDTVSGFLIERFGYIPDESAKDKIVIENISFQICEMKQKRIEKVLLVLGEE